MWGQDEEGSPRDPREFPREPSSTPFFSMACCDLSIATSDGRVLLWLQASRLGHRNRRMVTQLRGLQVALSVAGGSWHRVSLLPHFWMRDVRPRQRPRVTRLMLKTRLELLWGTFTAYEVPGKWPHLLCFSLSVCKMGMIQ